MLFSLLISNSNLSITRYNACLGAHSGGPAIRKFAIVDVRGGKAMLA